MSLAFSNPRGEEEEVVRLQKAYFSVFALKDGTIYLVNATRKPRKTKHSSAPRIDEDGIYNWYLEKEVVPKDMVDWLKGSFHSTVSTCLNVKRIVRQQVEPKLGQLAQDLRLLREQLERIEAKMDTLHSAASSRASDRP
jgi:hypothetical protein